MVILFTSIPLIYAETPWLPNYNKRQLFYWQSDIASQALITVINQTGFNTDDTFYIFNETLPTFEDLNITLSDGVTPLHCWNQTTYLQENCTFWTNFPTANTTYWLYWDNSIAMTSWNQTNTFEDVITNVVGAWLMDETNATDTVIDYSGNNNNGTPTNVEVSSGKFNNGKSFNNTNDVIACSDTSGTLNVNNTDDFSIELWFKTSTASSTYILRKGFTPGWILICRGDASGQLQMRLHDGVDLVDVYSDNSVNDGIWNHIVFVFDRDNGAKFYINNIADASWTDINVINDLSKTSDFNIGDVGSSPVADYDELRFYKTALTAIEVSNLYANYGDPTIEDGTINVRIWATYQITQWGTVETYEEFTSEDIIGIALSFSIVFSVAFAITLGLILRKK